MSKQAKKQTIKEQLEKELETWQTKMDEAKGMLSPKKKPEKQVSH